MESDSEGVDDDEEIFKPQPSRKRRRPAIESEDEFQDDGKDAPVSDDGMSPPLLQVSWLTV